MLLGGFSVVLAEIRKAVVTFIKAVKDFLSFAKTGRVALGESLPPCMCI